MATEKKITITIKDLKNIKVKEILNQYNKSTFIPEWSLTKLNKK